MRINHYFAAAAAALIAGGGMSGVTYDDLDPPSRHYRQGRRGGGAVRNFAATWIREWCNFGVVSVSRRRRVNGGE